MLEFVRLERKERSYLEARVREGRLFLFCVFCFVEGKYLAAFFVDVCGESKFSQTPACYPFASWTTLVELEDIVWLGT